jgi:hypothetical protein
MNAEQLNTRTARVLDRAKARAANPTPRYGEKPAMSLLRFRKQVKALFPQPDFRFRADFLGFTALSDDVTVEYNATAPDAARYEVWLGRLTPTTGATLPDAVRSARAALTTTLDAARRLEMDR